MAKRKSTRTKTKYRTRTRYVKTRPSKKTLVQKITSALKSTLGSTVKMIPVGLLVMPAVRSVVNNWGNWSAIQLDLQKLYGGMMSSGKFNFSPLLQTYGPAAISAIVLAIMREIRAL